MKFALNGGMIIGTLDGANIEIRDGIGKDNMFIFGLTADQIDGVRQSNSSKHVIEDPRLQESVNAIRSGEFGDPSPYHEVIDALIPSRDHYLLGTDFASYLDAHKRVDEAFRKKSLWAKMSILSTAGMGKFNSDRSIAEYASKVWDVQPCKIVTDSKDSSKTVCVEKHN